MEQITQSIVLVETRSLVSMKGEGRIRHTAVYSDGIIYLFGGSVGTVAYDNSIGIFDTSMLFSVPYIFSRFFFLFLFFFLSFFLSLFCIVFVYLAFHSLSKT